MKLAIDAALNRTCMWLINSLGTRLSKCYQWITAFGTQKNWGKIWTYMHACTVVLAPVLMSQEESMNFDGINGQWTLMDDRCFHNSGNVVVHKESLRWSNNNNKFNHARWRSHSHALWAISNHFRNSYSNICVYHNCLLRNEMKIYHCPFRLDTEPFVNFHSWLADEVNLHS